MIRYLWGKNGIRKVDDKDMDVLKHDVEKKPEIPFLSVFGKIHSMFLKRRNNAKRNRHWN